MKTLIPCFPAGAAAVESQWQMLLGTEVCWPQHFAGRSMESAGSQRTMGPQAHLGAQRPSPPHVGLREFQARGRQTQDRGAQTAVAFPQGKCPEARRAARGRNARPAGSGNRQAVGIVGLQASGSQPQLCRHSKQAAGVSTAARLCSDTNQSGLCQSQVRIPQCNGGLTWSGSGRRERRNDFPRPE